MNIFSRYKKPGGYIFMSKYYRYVIIKNNELKILKTKKMEMLKEMPKERHLFLLCKKYIL